MLASDRIVFLQFELFGIARVLFGHVKKAGVSRTYKLDIVFSLRHGGFLKSSNVDWCGNLDKSAYFVKLINLF
jgi:hypothetical protein